MDNQHFRSSTNAERPPRAVRITGVKKWSALLALMNRVSRCQLRLTAVLLELF
jgi:hypothetical protein